MSKSLDGSLRNRLIDFTSGCDGDDQLPEYTLKDITGSDFEQTHNGIQQAVCNWLRTFMGTKNRNKQGFGITLRFDCERELTEFTKPFSKPEKKVDITVSGVNDFIYLQFEVCSNNKRRPATIRKLCYGLVDQLVYLRNHQCWEKGVAGFYVSLKGCFEMVTCTWNSNTLRFVCTVEYLNQAAVQTSIMTEYNKISSYHTLDVANQGLSIPVGNDELKGVCALNTDQSKPSQLRSGFSVVIKVTHPSGGFVYKHPFNSNERDRLFSLMMMEASSSRFSKPLELKHYGSVGRQFFKFHLYHSPVTREVARRYIVPFVSEVIECVNALHKCDLAHLDIRIENVCFDDQMKAVLIDLDRSDDKNELVMNLNSYEKSTMYQDFTPSGIAEQLDWKQVAIMIHFILSPETTNYHTIIIEKGKQHDFFYEMFTTGMCII